MPVKRNDHQSQLSATPLSRTMLVTRFGVSVEKVVATIETPISHHGADLPDVKNSAVLRPARLIRNTAGRNETTIDTTTITQSKDVTRIRAPPVVLPTTPGRLESSSLRRSTDMKQLIRRPGLSVIFLAGVLATISAAAPKAGGAEPDFKALHAKVDAAWESLKAENASPVKYDGWAAYRDGAQKLFLDGATSLKFNVNDDLKVMRRGNVAWTTRTMHLKADMKDGKPVEFDGRDTVIWENRGGKWLIVHEHFSAPLPE